MNSGKSNSLALVLVAIFVIAASYFVMSGGSEPVNNLPAIEDAPGDTPVISAADQLSSLGDAAPDSINIARTSTNTSNNDIDDIFADRIGGTISGKVVDENLRVLGVEGLSVIDASVMPYVVSGNTNAATIMLAEKGADHLLAARR